MGVMGAAGLSTCNNKLYAVGRVIAAAWREELEGMTTERRLCPSPTFSVVFSQRSGG